MCLFTVFQGFSDTVRIILLQENILRNSVFSKKNLQNFKVPQFFLLSNLAKRDEGCK